MALTVSLVREYAYVLLRPKNMSILQNSLASYEILCRYGDTKDVLPIGGLVDIGEKPIAFDSRHYRQLINFVLKLHDRLCLF